MELRAEGKEPRLALTKQRLPNKDKLIRMYRRMQEIRIFEEKLYYLFLNRSMPGTIHQCVGQEAVAVGVCENLQKDDYITTTHRGHGHYIAKGGSLKELMAEMFAKKTGCCKGMGGSMHIAKLSVGILGTGGIVGAGVPIATGAALSAKLKGTKQVVACFFGDGAVNTGAFHEGVNLAAIWRLPIIFVCENNLYAFSTPINQTTLVKNLADRASGYGIPGIVVNGNDILAVHKFAQGAIQRARIGQGPTFIECKTYRHKGHARFDPAKYRPDEEIKEWLDKDPVLRFKNYLVRLGILTNEEVGDIEEEVKKEIEEAAMFAEESPDPEPTDFLRYIYA